VIAYERDGAEIYRRSFATIRAEADLDGLDPVDAEHIGTEVGEHHRRERAGSDPDELHHLHRGQRPSHGSPS